MIKDKERLVEELYRVLKKGGVISIVNSGFGSKIKGKQIAEDYLVKLFCKNNNFVLSEKIRDNFNFVKVIR